MGDIILDALKVERKDENTYTARVGPEHRFGEFLHGGFAASLIVYTALEHAKTTLGRTKQQNVTSVDLQYPKPVTSREVELRVEGTRLTKVTATLHVAVCQKGAPCVTGYVNLIDAAAHRGVTTDTGFTLKPPPTPVNLKNLESDTDDKWIKYHVPYTKLGSQPLAHWNLGMTKAGPVNYRTHDMWYSLHNEKNRITNIMVPLLGDLFLRQADNWIPESGFSYSACIDRASRSVNGDVRLEELEKATTVYWTATQSFNLDILRQLPEEGVKWLLLRAEAKSIKEGKLISDLTLVDEQHNLIAYGKIVDMLIPAQNWVNQNKRDGAKSTKM